jgi:hypothetical protein
MMNLNIKEILEPGVSEKERIVFEVVGSDDVGTYLVFLTKETTPNHIQSSPKEVFWFPDQAIKSGDLVVLYTNSGNTTLTSNSDGTTSYFFHWGKSKSIINEPQDAVALLKIQQWNFVKRE